MLVYAYTYLYQVGAEDVDQDRLTFSLVSGPDGLSIDAQTGLIQWTPDAGQDGSADVEIAVSDSLGASVSQAYTIVVADGQPNQLPVITSTPGFFATANGAYTYQIIAEDPDGDAITYTLLSSQAGMTVDAATGLLEWTPTSADLGSTIVEVVARDPALGGSIQQFSLTVLDANNAPVITSTPSTELASGQPFRYDVLATDADGDFLTYELVSGPDGFLIDGLGRTFWIPGASQLGDNAVEIKVTDTRGAFATQAFTINVAADTTAPQVAIQLSDNNVEVGSTIDIRVTAIDNVGVENLMLTLDGVAVALDANGGARVTLENFGGITAVATATDAAGNSGTDSIQILVADPNDVDGPVISIATPGDGDSITAPTDIIGSVMDDTLVSYRLLLGDFETRNFKEIATGTENVDNGVLGQIDPTLLRNGSYILRLEAFDAGGNGSVIEQAVEVTGDLKLGNFRQTFTDLVIPVSGIPIEIARVYDSLDADVEGGFGFGWRMEFRDTDLRVTLPKSGLEDIGIYSAFRSGIKLFINVPGEGRQSFTFNPDIRVLPGFGNSLVIAKPRFTADRGVTSSLSAGRPGNLIVNEFGELYAGGGIPYNPASPDFGGVYILTTDSGITYRIDGTTGKLLSAEDQNGNEITYSDSGITSNRAGTVSFERDAQGRIVTITDFEQNKINYTYDLQGNLETVTDREANTTQFEYLDQPNHYLEKVIDPLGREGAKLNYDENGRLETIGNVRGATTRYTVDPDNFVGSVLDPLGNELLYEYDDAGNIVSITDARGGQSFNEYNADNQVTSKTDALGNSESVEYDNQGNATSVTDGNGAVSRFAYDGDGNVVATIDSLGRTTKMKYDANENLVSMTANDGGVTTFAYDANGNLATTMDALGNEIEREYDQAGNTTSVVDGAGNKLNFKYSSNGLETESNATKKLPDGSISTIKLTREYDRNGRQTSVVDPLGNTTTAEFDANGNQLAATDPSGLRVDFVGNDTPSPESVNLPGGVSLNYEFDDNNQVMSITSQNASVEETEYDSVGNLILRRLADSTPEDNTDNPTIEYQYDLLSRMVATIDQAGAKTEFEYDAIGNRTLTRDALGNETNSKYDSAGQLSEQIDALGRSTKYTYDSGGRLIKVLFHDGTFVENEFDLGGNMIAATNENGEISRFAYDGNHQLAEVIDAEGNRTQYERDEVGNVVLARDAAGNVTRYEYDSLSRQTAVVRPLGQRSETTYRANGDIDSSTDFLGEKDTYIYGSDGRVTEVKYGSDSVQYEFDASGRLLSFTNANGKTEFKYDELGRLSERIDPDSQFVRQAFDSYGNVAATTTNFGTTSYTHDALQRLASVTSIDGEVTTYQYDAVGNVTLINFPNGTAETRVFDTRNRVTSSTVRDSSDAVLHSIQYTRDNTGNVVRQVDSNGRESLFEYDGKMQLTKETRIFQGVTRAIEYTYGASGNRTKKTDSIDGETLFLHDANDRLIETTGAEAAVYTYDANGNLLTKTETGIVTEYEWTSRDRLGEATITENGTASTVEYKYDDLGNRTVRKANGIETRYLFDQNRAFTQAIVEYSALGDLQRSYTYGTDEAISFSAQGDTTYLISDEIRTVVAQTDEQGNISGEYQYDAFGNLISDLPGIESPLQYTGEFRDPETGLTYLRARYLDNQQGRFISTDPYSGNFEDPTSLHRYLYSRNSPLVFSDPSGEFTLIEKVQVIGVIGGLSALYIAGWTAVTGISNPVKWSGAMRQLSVDASINSFNPTPSVGPSFSVGLQFNTFSTENGPNHDNGGYTSSYSGASLTILASAGVGVSAGFPITYTQGGFDLEVSRLFTPRYFASVFMGGPYLLLDGSFSIPLLGYTVGSYLQMGLGRGNASGFSINVGTFASGGITATGGLTIPLGDTSIYNLII